MTITNSRAALQAVEKSLSIQEGDSRASSIGKFFGGSLAKLTLAGLAGAEYGMSKAEDLVFKPSQSRTRYIDEASQTFFRALKSLNTPFAPKTERIKASWFTRSQTVTIEGPTVSSYISNGISRAKKGAEDAKTFAVKHKVEIALGVAFTATAVALYYFGPDLFSSASSNTVPQLDNTLRSNSLPEATNAAALLTNKSLTPFVDQRQPDFQATNLPLMAFTLLSSASFPIISTYLIYKLCFGRGDDGISSAEETSGENFEFDFSERDGTNAVGVKVQIADAIYGQEAVPKAPSNSKRNKGKENIWNTNPGITPKEYAFECLRDGLSKSDTKAALRRNFPNLKNKTASLRIEIIVTEASERLEEEKRLQEKKAKEPDSTSSASASTPPPVQSERVYPIPSTLEFNGSTAEEIFATLSSSPTVESDPTLAH